MTPRFADLVNRFSTTSVGRFVGARVSARIDPVIFKLSRGRYTSTGAPTLPMLALTTTGRRSGERRTVQLGYVADGDDQLVIGSNFGQAEHPGWRYNLEADPNAWALLDDGREVAVRASMLTDEQKAIAWPTIEAVIPQMKIYPTLTDRNIGVFRLTRR